LISFHQFLLPYPKSRLIFAPATEKSFPRLSYNGMLLCHRWSLSVHACCCNPMCCIVQYLHRWGDLQHGGRIRFVEGGFFDRQANFSTSRFPPGGVGWMGTNLFRDTGKTNPREAQCKHSEQQLLMRLTPHADDTWCHSLLVFGDPGFPT